MNLLNPCISVAPSLMAWGFLMTAFFGFSVRMEAMDWLQAIRLVKTLHIDSSLLLLRLCLMENQTGRLLVGRRPNREKPARNQAHLKRVFLRLVFLKVF